jgi:ABC-2 type transport system permease protein
VGGVPVAVSGALAVAIVAGDGGGAAATGVGLLAGAAAYAAIFTWAGLATKHALVIGLVYVFVWEAALAAYLDGIRFLSVRRFTLATIHGLDEVRLATVDINLGATAGWIGVAVVLVGFSALMTRKLSRMDVP